MKFKSSNYALHPDVRKDLQIDLVLHAGPPNNIELSLMLWDNSGSEIVKQLERWFMNNISSPAVGEKLLDILAKITSPGRPEVSSPAVGENLPSRPSMGVFRPFDKTTDRMIAIKLLGAQWQFCLDEISPQDIVKYINHIINNKAFL